MALRPLGRTNLQLCARCLRKLRRNYSSTNTAPPPPPTAGYAHLSNRRLISLHGPDAPKFLQGLTTNNLHPSWTSGWYSAFLTAQGRVLYDVFIYPTTWSRMYKDWLDTGAGKSGADGDWSCLIEVDAAQQHNLVKHLKRHKLRSKVNIRAVDEEDWSILAAWGNSASDAGQPQTPSVPDSEAPVQLVDPRGPGFGQRIVVPSRKAAGNLRDLEGLPQSELSAYTIRRYLHGIAEGQNEIISDHALPQESNIDFMDGVDFRKGCYIGQELTIRTHHTGVVRKRILPTQLYSTTSDLPTSLEYDSNWSGASPLPGADIKKAEGKGRSAGKFLAGVSNIGLSLCRLEMMTNVRLTAEGGTFTEGTEFKLQQEAEAGPRIKAFVPDWLRGQLKIRDPPRRVD